MKKKSSVIAKLIIPVAVLGCIAIMIAGVSLYSMTAVQKESNQISGEGVRATICMDEINLAFANTQKLTLALCAEPSKDLYEYVASQLTEYQSNVDSYEKELLAMDHYFTADDIQLMNETFDLLTEAQGTTVELMQTAMAGDSAAAVAKANSVMTEWSDTIAVNMDTLISRNDELVKQNIREAEYSGTERSVQPEYDTIADPAGNFFCGICHGGCCDYQDGCKAAQKADE